ncbi:MAG TPA: hypothetical protein DCZ40_13630 [Lachnospiraceae bacterium]|nr:hypothetical protein [Lachnospiraceae bacterium]
MLPKTKKVITTAPPVFCSVASHKLFYSTAENRNEDIYEEEILKQTSTGAVIVMMILATIFAAVQIFVGGGINWGIWSLVFSANMITFWMKYIKLHRKHELVMTIAYTIFVSVCSVGHIYNLIVSSATL